MLTLVTGGTGFLGRHLIERLRRHDQPVRALVRADDTALRSLGVELVLGDLRDAASVDRAVAGSAVVHHTAALAGVWGRYQDFYQVNVDGTKHVIDACLRHGVGRLVFTSSPSVTFDRQHQCGVDESVPYARRWLAHYPRTKALAEQAVLAAHGQNGLATCALRPHLIWGPGDRHLIPRLLNRARRGQLVRVGDGTNLVDITYVENAAAAHWQASQRLGPAAPCGGRAYFISQGVPVRCWAWIDEVLALAGLEPVRRSISLRTAWRIGALLEGGYHWLGLPGEPRMTRFLAAQLATSHYFDISAARRDLGYHPEVTISRGMDRLARTLTALPHR